MPIESEANGIITVFRWKGDVRHTRTVLAAERFRLDGLQRDPESGRLAAIDRFFPTLAEAIAAIEPRWISGELGSIWIHDMASDEHPAVVFTEALFSDSVKGARRKRIRDDQDKAIDGLLDAIHEARNRHESRDAVRQWLDGPGAAILDQNKYEA